MFDWTVHSDGRPARRLVCRILVPRPIEQVFSFFSDAANLEAITPPWVGFRIKTPLPIAMARGTIIDYSINLKGVPMRWRSEISTWEPPHRFVDDQLRGPYLLWLHDHTFRPVDGENGPCSSTEVVDTVHYRHLGGNLVHRMLVGPDLRRIFAYRIERMSDLLASMAAVTCPPNPDPGL